MRCSIAYSRLGMKTAKRGVSLALTCQFAHFNDSCLFGFALDTEIWFKSPLSLQEQTFPKKAIASKFLVNFSFSQLLDRLNFFKNINNFP